MKKLLFILSLITATLLINSCAMIAGPIAMGGAALISEDRRLSGRIVDDQLLEYKVNEAIYAQLRNQADVEVISYNGVVLLVGEVNSHTTSEKIVDLVSLFAQTKVEIVNETMVGQPTNFSIDTKDSILTAKVKSVLFAQSAEKANQKLDEVDNIAYSTLPFHVKVVSKRSVVYLMGLLSPNEQKYVKNVVSRVKGVSKVVSVFQDWDKIEQQRREKIGKLASQVSQANSSTNTQ